MSEVSRVPIYNKADSALWFIMCEISFALPCLKPKTESITKFNSIVSPLPPEVASLMRDILTNPDKIHPYNHLKTVLINRSVETSQEEISQLLFSEELDLTLDKAAEISDRILEVTPIPMEIHAVNKNNTSSFEQELLLEIEKLNARIEKIKLSCHCSRFRRCSCQQRFRDSSKNRDFSVCRYHHHFGNNCKPEKCVSPCKFQGNGNGDE
ncbi:uncharacterized protein TNCV_396321 [Trichonephila clavipes]|nr:uncharacterized protein TNCV_396321 [Trichonephila clavipes]